MDVLVESNRLESIAGMFHEREIPYTVAVADVNAILEFQQASLAKAFCKSKLMLIFLQLQYFYDKSITFSGLRIFNETFNYPPNHYFRVN